ncbi:phage baseplate protein [Psychrobacter sp. AOP7-A1-24]|uniref:phage baseplate protein n=1 Tax=Psychrobacter sp. AOP7-A1-24 TaxID=3457646 RepID=UPI00402B90FA
MLQGNIPQLQDLTADVWVEERHRREVEVVKNPIEFGSPITDHSYVKARTLSVSFGVTNTPLASNSSFSGNDRIAQAREKLYKLQDESVFLTVNTINGGEYENCLLSAIGWTTDVNNPHSIIFELEMEEVIITGTKKTTYQPLPADERTAGKTSSTEKRGEVSKRSRESADEARRNYTADSNTSSDELAKNAAAKAQAAKIEAVDNRTILKKISDIGFGGIL